MSQFSHAAPALRTGWKMWFLNVFAVMFAQTVSADSVSEAPTTIRAPTTVYVPPVPTVQLMSAEWDVFLTEKVELSCSIEGSSGWNFKWFRNEQELQEDSGLLFKGDGSVVMITAEAETQSGAYTCKGEHQTKGVSTKISNKFNIKVNDPPKPTLKLLTPWSDVFVNEAVHLSCDINKSGWMAVWYRDNVNLGGNGKTLEITSASQSDQGEYSCKANLAPRGVSSSLSNTATVKVHASKPKPRLSRDSNFDVMYPGESITFTCMVDVSSGWEYVWYQKKKEISGSNTFRIPSLGPSDSGDYHCKAKRGQNPFYTEDSDVASLQVSDPPTPILKHLTPWSDVFETEEVKFSCEVSSSGWTFTWYKDKVKLDDERSLLSIASVSQSHQGEYSCKANLAPRGVSSDFSNTSTVKVYASKPKPRLSRDSNFDAMYPGESITFTCMVDVSSGWEYVWYQKKKEISGSNTFTIPSLGPSHSGDYHCKAKRGQNPFYTEDSDVASLQVSDPPTPILKLLTPWSDVFENEEVKFSCEVSSSGWTFTWYKDEVKLDDERSLLSIASVSQSHQGEYSCKANLAPRGVSSDFSNTSTVKVYEKVPTPTLNKKPDSNPMYIGEEVHFTCKVDVSSGWNYQWFKNGNSLGKSGDAISIKLDLPDEGKYSCKASRGVKTSTGHSEEKQQVVEEIPVPSLKPVTQWLDVFPGEAVKLRCEMQQKRSVWTYTWYRNGEEVQSCKEVTIDTEGINLSIPSASSSLGGGYSCSGELEGRSVRSNLSSVVTLDVYDAKPKITLVQNPEYSLMHTDDSVSFSCEVSNSSGWDYLWYKDSNLLATSENSHVHNITSGTKADTGSYECQVKRGVKEVYFSDKSEGAKIEVHERPQASIILQTDWSEVFSTDSLLLKCEVVGSNDNWNYTWFREGEQVDPSSEKSEKYTVTPQNDPAQSHYTCKGIRNGRPSYSRSSDSFKTKNLLLKRRILLSISGCLFFGIIAVLLGCIFLRVFRKPASEDEKPDEDNLFLTMAQLKDFTDAPCPLAAYITENDLNTSPKEADDNGTICSETTPLPITSQEDQAVTTGSDGTTENGAGMVSFHT
ncbi:obscurin [Cololabis saira]|uniref:obscurin n=1 Tax=Cololabis saira TaxID=129043 RepID=UPI002AD42D1A|nr:obscurin [Cololabis saira]